MSVHVFAYSHELMEGVPHPCIFKGRCSHFERGWGTWKIDMHNDGGQKPLRHTWPQWSVKDPQRTKHIHCSIVLNNTQILVFIYKCE